MTTSAGAAKLLWKVEDVADLGSPKRVDRLRVVADDSQARAIRLQRGEDRRLQAIGVLIFIDEDMVEARGKMRGDLGLARHLRPVEKQVVVIENVLRLLRFDIACEQRLQFFDPAGAPGEHAAENFAQRCLRVHGARVDRKARALGRKPAFGFRVAKVVPDEVHQVGAVFAVVDSECRIEPNLQGIVAQQPRADAVECAGPGQAHR